MEISDKGYEIKNENGKIVISKNGIPKPSLDVNSNYYCVGYYILYCNWMSNIISHTIINFKDRYILNI